MAPAVGGLSIGGVSGGTTQLDAWELLLTSAGLEARDERPMPGGPLTPTQADRLLRGLLGKPVSLGQFPARLAAGYLLRKVLERGEMPRAELVRQVERFAGVAVLRPDGCLAWVRNGATQQRVAPVEWRDGAFRAHGFELGRFYDGRTAVFRLMGDDLQIVDRHPVGEVYSDADYVGRTLDGAEAAFVKLALSIGYFFTYPLDSIASLKNLPAGVAALIESSPEYFERFRWMTKGEQIQAVAELATNLLLTTGTASAATRTVTGLMAGAEATVPVLSLSAQGALTIERVAIPVGRAAAVLGGGPGAAIILQRVGAQGNQEAPSDGPGRWEFARESMEESARRYEKEVTGAPDGQSYVVGDVKFDGYKDGVLLEAKGPGYAKFIPDAAESGGWFQGFRKIVNQAERQLEVANGTPIRWHFAEREAADFVREIFRTEGLGRIKVVYTPPSL
ncbi:Tox-REase-5 domain-containing protein [Citreicoccus inhibens]|uniref:Tox-REase-5 domain-containing protein n=1 Tax=Citreicoccus inhibens TaxID=2849499 RepID=UPI002E282CCF|nr:Tox-REase-5 domain-containing protein [Citreicoccus inhibens]